MVPGVELVGDPQVLIGRYAYDVGHRGSPDAYDFRQGVIVDRYTRQDPETAEDVEVVVLMRQWQGQVHRRRVPLASVDVGEEADQRMADQMARLVARSLALTKSAGSRKPMKLTDEEWQWLEDVVRLHRWSKQRQLELS